MTTPESLDDLVFRYLERVEAGERGDAVLADLASERPDQADALRRGVALLQETRLHPGPDRDGLPEAIGPFRLVSRLGAGGMGVVYLAEQDNPRRRVALKLVRPDQLYFEGSRERFEREIQSVARLSHPGIAQILEMGEHAGVPWFSQELVIGAPLSDVLAGLPARAPEAITGADARAVLADHLRAQGEEIPASEWDEEFFRGSWVEVALHIARQVAEALQHAHERGVLHRDVKPSNVLLTPGGRAVLVDFGLATLPGTERITRTGVQLGSLHYMPPEQLDGRVRDIGPRSDVYSLGVTLYELFTLRAPYSSQSVERLRSLILHGDAQEARRINPSVARDASVVCATAMEPGLARRYPSAADFGADVAAVLGHRPITARPAGTGLRLLRWCQRRPALALGAVASVLVFVVAPIVFGVQRTLAARELAGVNQDLQGALRVSEANLESAVQAIDRVMRWAADDGLDDVPGMLALRAEVADEALSVFGGLRATRPDDEDLAFLEAKLLTTKGKALSDLGQHAEAEPVFDHASSTLAAHASASDSETRWVLALARLQFARAQNLGNRGLHSASVPHYRQALENLRLVEARDPGTTRYLGDIGSVTGGLAHAVSSSGGTLAEVTELIGEAALSTETAVALDPRNLSRLIARFGALRQSTDLHSDAGRFAEAERDVLAAIEISERALELEPGNRTLRLNLAWALRNLGWILITTHRDPALAEEHLERALELCEAIVDENPGIPEFQSERLGVLQLLAGIRRRRGDKRGAYAAGLEIAQGFLELVADDPDSLTLRMNAASSWINVGNYALTDEERGEERIDLVLEHCDTAEGLLDGIRGPDATSRLVQEKRMALYFQRGSARYWREDVEGLVREIEACEALAPELPYDCFLVAFLWMRVWELTQADEDRDEGIRWLDLAVAAGFSNLGMLDQSEMIESFDVESARLLRAVVAERAGEG